MRAMILAAGFGTRLLPHTEKVPKPLFTLGGKTALEMSLESLARAGCDAAVVNVHHLADKIEAFLSKKSFPMPVFVSREPVILGAGGAIKKVENFWGDEPFLVVNSDIATDIDFKEVYEYHLARKNPVTVALTRCEAFDSVSVDERGLVRSFRRKGGLPGEGGGRLYTFTGIQVLEKKVLEYIPPGTFYGSIDAYESLMADGGTIGAFMAEHSRWRDIGNEERYRDAVLEIMAPQAFERAFSKPLSAAATCVALKGDGSDRKWSRIQDGTRSLVFVEHGIHADDGSTSEADSFVNIGKHLFERGAPVPEIVHHDVFSGFVFVQDLGDASLMDTVKDIGFGPAAEALYREAVESMVLMWRQGAVGFDPSWTWQSPSYDRALVLEKECRYFTDAFLRGHLHLNVSFDRLAPDFFRLADRAVEYGCPGFMHRDFQSRNIMVKDGHVFFIDFQAGRIGPVQYDLASLLNDPYVSLPETMRSRLLEYCAERFEQAANVPRERFLKGYRYCALARNLQILGAFSFLSGVKKKEWFAQFIPQALQTLKDNLGTFFPKDEFPLLKAVSGIS